MKIIYNNIIPFKGFRAINLFGIIFAKKGHTLNEISINHEAIHTAQMKELLYIPYYIWYLIEWITLLFKDYKTAYKNIRFEKEACKNKHNLEYLKTRKHYNYL